VQVAEVMTPVSVSDSPEQTLRAAAAQMWRSQTGSLLVMERGRLLGIVTERDLLRAVAAGGDLDATVVGDVMTADVYTVVPETPIYEAARQMAARWIRHLPVMASAPTGGSGTVVGVVSLRDLVAILGALGQVSDEVVLPNDELVRSRRLTRIEHGDLD
jgi:CBS domain-containing protein